jgi:hypothetical protein
MVGEPVMARLFVVSTSGPTPFVVKVPWVEDRVMPPLTVSVMEIPPDRLLDTSEVPFTVSTVNELPSVTLTDPVLPDSADMLLLVRLRV